MIPVESNPSHPFVVITNECQFEESDGLLLRTESFPNVILRSILSIICTLSLGVVEGCSTMEAEAAVFNCYYLDGKHATLTRRGDDTIACCQVIRCSIGRLIVG